MVLSSAMNVSCVNITIAADLVIENEETFQILATSSDEAVNLTSNTATVMILDTTTGQYNSCTLYVYTIMAKFLTL